MQNKKVHQDKRKKSIKAKEKGLSRKNKNVY